VHLPRWADAEWLKQFVAEQLVTVRNKRGFARLEWQKLRERNEALDARVYARAAAWIAGADRWSEATWRDLEQQLGTGEVDPAPSTKDGSSTAEPAAPSAGMVRRRRARGRRVITPAYLR
jgi:phage terminase large subunit GpA-like protein